MNWKEKLATAFVGIFIGAMLLIGTVTYYEEKLAQATTPVVFVQEKGQLNADKITTWVYKKSTKISMRQAGEIVDGVMQQQNPLLLLALMQAESEFSPSAMSNAGAIGLGQIMWKHWEKPLMQAGICKERRDLFDYQNNIRATSFILHSLLIENDGDISKTLERYVGGGNRAYKEKIVWNFMDLSVASGRGLS